jgi:hypothetical protein
MTNVPDVISEICRANKAASHVCQTRTPQKTRPIMGPTIEDNLRITGFFARVVGVIISF